MDPLNRNKQQPNISQEKISPQELREKLKDPYYLPKNREEIMSAFSTFQEWYNFCFDEENPVFEFLNEEFIDRLSDYLAKRIEELKGSEESPIIILEVGAGNGRLSHFLRQKLQEKVPGKFKIIAVDSGEWGIKPVFEVEKMDYREALKKYNPQIIICSWMPYKVDFTGDFRATASVKEYILIGETDGGCCGDEWLTWGYRPLSYEEGEEEKSLTPPYAEDGFEREDLMDISRKQICRTDFPPFKRFNSRTVSFRRKEE